MGKLHPPPGVQGPTLDVQVLEGLERYIATEDFLHKLEQASAEWIDLSEHQHHPSAAWPHDKGLDLTQAANQDSSTAAVASTDAAAQADASNSSSSWFGRAKTSSVKQSTSSTSPGGKSGSSSSAAEQLAQGLSQSPASSNTTSGGSTSSASMPASSPAGLTAAATAGDAGVLSFELVEQPQPQRELGQQEPFVLVSREDAIEGMAYYIALYLSRAPEARYMEPAQLQAALKRTFTAIRRSRYRAIWDWGRWLYRLGAVSYSALQLYEHPWLVHAVVAAIWTSSKMALGFLW